MTPATLPPDEHLYEGSMDIHRRIVALYPKVAEKHAFFRALKIVTTRGPGFLILTSLESSRGSPSLRCSGTSWRRQLPRAELLSTT